MRISKNILIETKKQFALDCNINEAKQINEHIYLSPYKKLKGARVHEKADPFFRAISFFGDVFICAREDTLPGWEEIFKDVPADWLFRYDRLRIIDHICHEYGRQILDTHIYFLPDEDAEESTDTEGLIWLDRNDIAAIKDTNPFNNALCYSSTQPDYIAVKLCDEAGRDIGMAGVSEDGAYLYQIGIDVSEEYRGQGIATRLVTAMKNRLLSEGKVPFYGTSEGHSLSRSVAVKSGFVPAFAEILVCKR